MKSTQNIIHSSAFNFEYKDKTSASRCNILIESIFNSHILPELEKAISNHIPEGMLIELSKLEINIGTIDEKEISANLGSRIRTSLEDALRNTIKFKENALNDNVSLGGQKSKNYLIQLIEFFFINGYFRFGLDESVAIDDLVIKAIDQNKNELITIIKKYARFDVVIRRITYSLSPKTFDLVLFALDPVNIKWIVDLRKILTIAKKEANLNQYNDDKFIRALNFSILKYLLNKTSSDFNKVEFARYLWKELKQFLNADFNLFVQSIKEHPNDNDKTNILITKILNEPKEERIKFQQEKGNRTFDITDLLKILNSGDTGFKNIKREFLKDEIVRVINDREQGGQLMEGLNRTGAELILELFYRNNVSSLIKLIISFTNSIALEYGAEKSESKALSINKFVLLTVLYLHENAIRELDMEKYVLFLIHTAGLEDSKTINSDAFNIFLKTQATLDVEKIQSLIYDKRQYPEISHINQSLTLDNLKQEQTEFQPEEGNRTLDIGYLLKILNSGGSNLKTIKREFLKDEIILAINDREKRVQLIEGLNRKGAELILELFYQNNVSSLVQLIHSFTKSIAREYSAEKSGNKALSVNEFVLITILYLHENAIRELDREELVLLLIYNAGLEDSKTVNSEAFKSFLQTQTDIDEYKINSLIDDERQYHEISSIQKLLSKNEKQTKSDASDETNNIPVVEEYFAIYKRKIIRYFFDLGYLPGTFYDLNWKEIQHIFSELIHQNDDFLVEIIRKNEDHERLIHRINLLIANKSVDDLEEYLIHFFNDEYAVFTKLVTETEKHFSLVAGSRINLNSFRNEILIRALAVSKGGSLPGVFMISVMEQIDDELQTDSPDSESLIHYITSGEVAEFDGLKKQYDSFSDSPREQLKKLIEGDFKLLLGYFHFKEFSVHPLSPELQELIKKIAFYFQVNQQVFLDIVQENTGDLNKVYTLFKYYLPQNQWQYFEKSLLSRPVLRSKIEMFQKHSDLVIEKFAEPEFDVANTLENISAVESEKLKSLLVLLMSDKSLFEKFVSSAKFQIILKLLVGDSKTESYINQLMSFSPGASLSGQIDRRFWKSVVLRVVILISIEEKSFTSKIFVETFMYYLLQNLKQINEEDKFYDIPDEMYSSGSKELKEIVETWKDSDNKGPSENEKYTIDRYDFDEKETSGKINYYFSVLRFYAIKGFFPWWAEKISFPEIIYGFKKASKNYPGAFEEIFLRFEREEHIFELLIRKIPGSISAEFGQIISSHSESKAIWGKILKKEFNRIESNSKNKKKNESGNFIDIGKNAEQLTINDFKESELLFKGIYFLEDEAILNGWLKNNQKISAQINEYLLLSPYFYFRNLSPSRWRQMVYEFSMDYYGDDSKNLKNQFHKDFLSYLNRKYSNINWTSTFKSVYKVIQSSKIKGPAFPEELGKLVNIEKTHPKMSTEIRNDENNFLAGDDTGNEVRVYNAGLILFWPFLTRLFEHLALLKNGAFINNESSNRAVYILQYLVFNEIDFPEYELVLNKLLVGMPSQIHLDPFIELTQEEKDMAQSLLHGLINNWDKVKNSSPEGIQETFMQREGILKFETDKVSLIVEKKGVDVLLNSIPWNISLIKLTWMKRPIYVQWI